MTVKISFLLLLLSISINTPAGERIDGISGSMGKSFLKPFSSFFNKDTKDQVLDVTDEKKNEDVIVETKFEADPAYLSSEQEKTSTNTLPEIDLIADINAEFEDTINNLAKAESKSALKSKHKKPIQLFPKDLSTIKATSKNNALHATNKMNNSQPTNDTCVKEKVYSLDVEDASQYKHLEDFPFTYECVISR